MKSDKTGQKWLTFSTSPSLAPYPTHLCKNIKNDENRQKSLKLTNFVKKWKIYKNMKKLQKK